MDEQMTPTDPAKVVVEELIAVCARHMLKLVGGNEGFTSLRVDAAMMAVAERFFVNTLVNICDRRYNLKPEQLSDLLDEAEKKTTLLANELFNKGKDMRTDNIVTEGRF